MSILTDRPSTAADSSSWPGLSWLTPVGQLLADQAERTRQPAQSIILLWLGGGPSQLETFDPHPGTRIAGGTKAIATAVKGIQLAEGFEQLADQMGSVALIRSMVSKEGDHERGTYLMKTGYRPDPDGRAPLDRRDLLPRAAGRSDGHSPAHLDPDRHSGRAGAGSWAANTTRSRSATRRGKLPDVTSAVAGPRELARVQRSGDRRTGLRPRPRRGRVESTLHRETLARAG